MGTYFIYLPAFQLLAKDKKNTEVQKQWYRLYPIIKKDDTKRHEFPYCVAQVS